MIANMEKEIEYEQPSRTEKAEAIRRKFCLENNQVYEAFDDDNTFFKSPQSDQSNSVIYMCFEEKELVSITHNGKKFYIYKT